METYKKLFECLYETNEEIVPAMVTFGLDIEEGIEEPYSFGWSRGSYTEVYAHILDVEIDGVHYDREYLVELLGEKTVRNIEEEEEEIKLAEYT